MPSMMAGRQRKHGPLGILTQLSKAYKHGGEAVPMFPSDWVAARVDGERHAPPPLRVAHIMMSNHYRIIYVKCTKTAGSTVVRTFNRKLCGCPGREAGTTCNCLSYVHFDNPAAVRDALEKWDSYFVFSFSRNVLRRAVSQYQYLTHMMDPACPVLSWEQYCHDPYTLADFCHMMLPTASSRAGRTCCRAPPSHHYEHAGPQAHCLTTEDGRPAVDWVGRVESMEEDLAALVDLLNQRPGVPKLQVPRPGELGHVNINLGACQQRELGGAAGGVTQAPGGSLQSRRRLAGEAPLPAAAGPMPVAASSSPAASPAGQAAGAPGRMKVLQEQWQPRNGTLNLCDKNDMFRGRYRHCYDALTAFYAEDLRLLHGL